MTRCASAVLVGMILAFLPAHLRAQRAQSVSPPSAAEQTRAPRPYSLPPGELQKAVEYARARYALHFAGELYGIGILAGILALGLAARFRDWAETFSQHRFLEAAVFVALLMLTNDVLNLPLGLYGQHLELAFDQSIQSWPSWFWDWTKSEFIAVALAIVLVFILYAVIRRSPRRWWFYFWLASLPILFTLMFLEPLVLEPLFYRFEPLAAQHPALVDQLEKVVARGGLAIPRDRMFEMKASEKVKSLNAYVSGLGATQRVVVWDTTLQAMTTPEILFVFGHEMGHYVLGHIRDSLLLLSLLFLVLLFAGYHALGWLLDRLGQRWRIRGISDWASLPALLLIAAVLAFFSEPLVNSYSRWQEHQADVYGLEVIHGIVPDSTAVAARSFQILGEQGLDEPNPNRFIEFWLYSHPSISERIAFSESYDPWPHGAEKYVK
jgi:Zn-dependent protease with chaperone function